MENAARWRGLTTRPWLQDPVRWQIVEQGGQGAAGGPLQSHIHTQINREEERGSETDCTTPGLPCGEISLKPLLENHFGVEAAV